MSKVRLPKETRAFICANCGAVSLSPNGICKIQGQGTKADWCGTPSLKPPSFCHNKKNNDRWQCTKCRQVSVNPELLCKPEKLPMSEGRDR